MAATQNDKLTWFKATASTGQQGCVEIAHLPAGGVALRDTKDRAKPAHRFSSNAWAAFLTSAKAGDFDSPHALAARQLRDQAPALHAWRERAANDTEELADIFGEEVA